MFTRTFLEDAIKLYEDLKSKYPSTKYMNQIYIDLSLIHYRNKIIIPL